MTGSAGEHDSTQRRGTLGLIRALVLSWLAVTLTALAHLGASPGELAGATHAPSLFACAILAAMFTVASLPLCMTRYRLPRTGPLLLAQQVAGHLALASMMPSGTHAVTQRPIGGPAAMGQVGQALRSPHTRHTGGGGGAPAGPQDGVALTHDLLPSPTMALAHCAAAVAIAAALAHTEAASTALAALVAYVRSARARLVRLIVQTLTCWLTPQPLTASISLSRNVKHAHRVALPSDVWRSPAPCRRGPPIAFAG